MTFNELYLHLAKETCIGIIVNEEFQRVYEEDEYPDYMELEVDRIVSVGTNQINVYLTDGTKSHWLDIDAAEGRCLGDIVD